MRSAPFRTEFALVRSKSRVTALSVIASINLYLCTAQVGHPWSRSSFACKRKCKAVERGAKVIAVRFLKRLLNIWHIANDFL